MSTTKPPKSQSSSGTLQIQSRSKKWIRRVITVFILLVLGTALLLPLICERRVANPVFQCVNNLHNLNIALLNYESDYGTFPPAYVADKDGKPLYSWRVLLLPYFDRQDLYEQFHLDEPWDSPHNLPLSQTDFRLFHCPSEPTTVPGQTSYVMVVGPGMISEGTRSYGLKDITDGPATTILLVEMAGSGIHWAEPRDLDVSNATVVPCDSDKHGLRSWHPGGVNVSFADGHIDFLDETIDPKLLRALLTRNGGEDVNAFNEQGN